jgi:hypothetical protein
MMAPDMMSAGAQAYLFSSLSHFPVSGLQTYFLQSSARVQKIVLTSARQMLAEQVEPEGTACH